MNLLFINHNCDLTITDTQVFTGDKTVGFVQVTDTDNFTISKGSTGKTTFTFSYKDLVWDPFWKKRRGELQETTVYAANNNLPVTLEARNNIMNNMVLSEPTIGFE